MTGQIVITITTGGETAVATGSDRQSGGATTAGPEPMGFEQLGASASAGAPGPQDLSAIAALESSAGAAGQPPRPMEVAQLMGSAGATPTPLDFTLVAGASGSAPAPMDIAQLGGGAGGDASGGPSPLEGPDIP